MESAPKRIAHSKAITTYAGIDRIGLPPVTSGQSMEVHEAKAKPVAAPVSPPARVKTLTGLWVSASPSSRSSCSGRGA